MNAATTDTVHEIAAALVRLGFIRSIEALTKNGQHWKWQSFLRRGDVMFGVRKPRNASDFSKLIFEVNPRRGHRGAIYSFAEMRINTAEAGWEPKVAHWIGEQLPLAQAQVEQEIAQREHHSAIRDEARKVQDQLRALVAAAYSTGKCPVVMTNGEGIAGARMEVFIAGRTAEEIMATIKRVLELPDVA